MQSLSWGHTSDPWFYELQFELHNVRELVLMPLHAKLSSDSVACDIVSRAAICSIRFLRGSSSQGWVTQVLAGTDAGTGMRGHVGVWGGGDSAVQPHSTGGVQGGRGGTHTHTHRNTHTHTHTHRNTHRNIHANVAPTL